jgi:hypothetical protein
MGLAGSCAALAAMFLRCMLAQNGFTCIWTPDMPDTIAIAHSTAS